MRFFVFTLLCLCLNLNLAKAQIVNYVNNPSFEVSLSTSSLIAHDAAKFWGPLDSLTCNAYLLRSKFLGTVPIGFGGYQYPRTGNNFVSTTFYCDPSTCGGISRWYPRNRLKKVLKANTEYCAKYYVVNTNNNVVAIDAYGIYFSNYNLDTIRRCAYPLTYLYPQVENHNGIIVDTANWIPITGTFTAIGDEKYMVLGNFKLNILTNTLIINPTFLPSKSNDIYIDDVSLIELDLPAFAGHDTTCIPGTSVYIGRQRDVGIDEACKWYQLPITITPTTPAIDTAAGIWVSPTQTSTYVVRQEICGNVKWDTVIVYKDGLGLFPVSSSVVENDIRIFPNPTKDKINFLFNQPLTTVFDVSITNLLGETLFYKSAFKLEVELNIAFLPPGLYHLKIENKQSKKVFKLLRD